MLAVFVAVERRTAEPMLDVRLFTNLRFTAASLAVTASFFALFGFIFLITQYFQFVKPGDGAAQLTRVAQEGFIDGLSAGCLGASGVALLGALFVARYLPAHPVAEEAAAPPQATARVAAA